MACYAREQWLYFVFSTDFKIHVFNENMVKVSSLHSKTRLVRQCQWYERQRFLLTAGVDGFCLLKLRINSQHGAKLQLMLDPRGNAVNIELHYKIKIESFDKQWIRGFHNDPKTDLFAVWSDTDLNFYAPTKQEEEQC